MPTVKNFIFCLNTVLNNEISTINGPLCAITPEYIPGLYSFGVNFSILDLTEGSHTVTLDFKDNCNTTIASINEMVIDYKKDPNENLPNEHVGITAGINFQNIEFKTSGMYCMNVFLDNQFLDSFKIFIRGLNEGK